MGKTVLGIAPHGYSVIGELAGKELKAFEKIRHGMIHFAQTFYDPAPETIIVFTPHGIRVKDKVMIYQGSYAEGYLSANGETVHQRFDYDNQLSEKLYEGLSEKFDMVESCVLGSAQGPFSVLPLDWGCAIPLKFIAEALDYKPKVVIVSLDIYEDAEGIMVDLGREINKIVEQEEKSIGIIISADQGHCHDEAGPYGYHPASKEFDELMIDVIVSNDFENLKGLDSGLIEDGKMDSLMQTLILSGLIEGEEWTNKLLTYDAPTYFGMLVATYTPSNI